MGVITDDVADSLVVAAFLDAGVAIGGVIPEVDVIDAGAAISGVITVVATGARDAETLGGVTTVGGVLIDAGVVTVAVCGATEALANAA